MSRIFINVIFFHTSKFQGYLIAISGSFCVRVCVHICVVGILKNILHTVKGSMFSVYLRPVTIIVSIALTLPSLCFEEFCHMALALIQIKLAGAA